MSMRDRLKKIVPDALFLRLKYRRKMGRSLNLKDPKTLNEKLQWLKLHDRNPEYIKMVDKYEAKKYVAERIGEEYIIPMYGVWDKFEDIDFDSLPNQFVLKCTHDSGGVIICPDKKMFNIDEAREKLNDCLQRNYFWAAREWPYKNIKPRIIAEKYIVDETGYELRDYKFYCFDGQVDVVLVCTGRNTGATKYYFFDREWKLRRYNKLGRDAPEDFSLPKPKKMDEMFEVATILSEGIPFVRIDLYNAENHIYFGEYTFYPDGGFDTGRLYETDLYFGSKLNLNEIGKVN